MRQTNRIMTGACLLVTVIGLIGLIACWPAYGLFGEFPNDKPVESSGHPKKVVEAVNEATRLYGWGQDGGLTFYFKGRTKDLNRFLRTLASARGCAFTITLVPGKQSASKRRRGFVGEGEKKVPTESFQYDWMLTVSELLRHPQFEALLGPEFVVDKKSKWMIDIEVSLGGAVQLDKLQLPLAYQASIGGHLADFVKYHNGRRNRPLAAGATSRPSSTQPTSRPRPPAAVTTEPTSVELWQKALERQGLFGDDDDDDDDDDDVSNGR